MGDLAVEGPTLTGLASFVMALAPVSKRAKAIIARLALSALEF
jgi:hypothetical protein